MPNRLSKPNRPRDVSEWAHQITEESTREAKPTPSVISKVMAEMEGGRKIGGKRRMETMTAEQRSKIASNAAKKRWAKVNATSAQRF